ncbi:MAG TPA: low affinity iron permease family protein [Hyphomonadaceae bacterium]|jgi:low affinity Fe/Cu permease|nr:low affinity iron permease family protein [Hyphomonadaceae bacterium]
MGKLFTRFANSVSELAGNPITFIVCAAYVIVWACTGPLFGFSDTWQLVINTSTTIITFLMVFLIQNTQNRDNGAIHAKLDELIRAMVDADNEFIGIEHLTDEELKAILQDVEKNAHKLHEERKRREGKGGKSAAKSSATDAAGDKDDNGPKATVPKKPRAKTKA